MHEIRREQYPPNCVRPNLQQIGDLGEFPLPTQRKYELVVGVGVRDTAPKDGLLAKHGTLIRGEWMAASPETGRYRPDFTFVDQELPLGPPFRFFRRSHGLDSGNEQGRQE